MEKNNKSTSQMNFQIKKNMLEINKMTFNINDLNMLLDEDNLSVADIIQNLLELRNTIENLKNLINLNNEEIKKISQYFLNLKNNKKSSDILSRGKKSNENRFIKYLFYYNQATFFSRF